MNTCTNCQKNFTITDNDKDFYKSINVPHPTHCPDCRQQRRLAWRNERSLHIRDCDATGERILSVFSPNQPFPVYENEYWFSDKWNPLDYGQDFDFDKPFFKQFHELHQKVPQMTFCATANQNCDYVNQCGWSKDCYLIFEADGNEKCLYGNNIYDSISCIDTLHVTRCELCYECTDCQNCYNLKFSQNCKTCTDSLFLKNCIGCSNCIGCVNLRNKQYHIFNQPHTKEEYEAKHLDLQQLKQQFTDLILQFPHKCLYGTQNEDSSGDYLFNTQRCHNCFDLHNAQDCKFVYNCRNMKKVYDVMAYGAKKGAEFCYECHTIGDGTRNVFFSDQIWGSPYNLYYCQLCINNSHDLFGCIGLRHMSYCILNKQYTREEYKKLVPQIIEHMTKTNEYGEFFPAKLSPFPYSESVAQEYYPINEQESQKEYQKQTYSIPENINEVPDTICQEILACEITGKNFKILPQELDFYRKNRIPIPKKHPDQRHKDRLNLRNPRKLWQNNCKKCGTEIQTSYSPNRQEIVYCEKCYLETVD